jgi:hypothetical protein
MRSNKQRLNNARLTPTAVAMGMEVAVNLPQSNTAFLLVHSQEYTPDASVWQIPVGVPDCNMNAERLKGPWPSPQAPVLVLDKIDGWPHNQEA